MGASDHVSLALQALRRGALDVAAQQCELALAERPGDAQALHLCGIVTLSAGDPRTALSFFEQSLLQEPDDARTHNNLGQAYLALGELQAARRHLERACALQSDYSGALNTLGAVYRRLSLVKESREALELALALAPEDVAIHSNLGCLENDQGRPKAALQHFERALKLEPGRPEVHRNMGLSLNLLGRWAEALEHFQQAGGLRAEDPELCLQMGLALLRVHRSVDAEICLQRALLQHPEPAQVHNALGALFNQQGRVNEAFEALTAAVELEPAHRQAQSNRLLNLHYLASVSPSELQAQHLGWAGQRDAAGENAVFTQQADPERKLRLGYLSPDFRRHPVGFFVRRLWEHHDQQRFEVFVYAHAPREDDFTEELRRLPVCWRDCRALDVAETRALIREDRIDILFDLAGHTAGNRLDVFSPRSAPVQVTGMGYVNTTGLAEMDYLLCDSHHLPPEDEGFYAETALRMEHDYICYAPPDYAPEPGPLPAQATGLVTFGNFNNLAKLGVQVVELWSELLLRVQPSRLLLKTHALGDPATRSRLVEMFGKCGVQAERLILEGGARHADLLASYQRVDLALDPFPYSGGLTTLEALWMGVPVVTMTGRSFASRHSTSHLRNLGLQRFVVDDSSSYLELAVDTVANLDALAELRGTLRPRMAQSVLCDGQAYAAELESRLRERWRQWCRQR